MELFNSGYGNSKIMSTKSSQPLKFHITYIIKQHRGFRLNWFIHKFHALKILFQTLDFNKEMCSWTKVKSLLNIYCLCLEKIGLLMQCLSIILMLVIPSSNASKTNLVINAFRGSFRLIRFNPLISCFGQLCAQLTLTLMVWSCPYNK
jgi:hypothetical protein